MFFQQLFDPETSTYTYVFADPQTRAAAIVDPVRERVIDTYLPLLSRERLTLQYVLETHPHADHVTGASALREATHARVVVHSRSPAACADLRVEDRAVLHLDHVPIEVIYTPGHTPCHVSYRVNQDRVLTGDSLLIGGCGRTDFQAGDPGAQYDSITGRLFTLPPATLVFPGHDYRGLSVSTIEAERARNPRLAGRTRDDFITLMRSLALAPPKHIMEAVPPNERCGRSPDAGAAHTT
jgi:sulfur dioxygenase